MGPFQVNLSQNDESRTGWSWVKITLAYCEPDEDKPGKNALENGWNMCQINGLKKEMW